MIIFSSTIHRGRSKYCTGESVPLLHCYGRHKVKSVIGGWVAVICPSSSYGWLRCWEIYLIVLVAAFLRLFQFNTTEFDADQSDIFQMARYAVTHGFIPTSANVASIGIYHLPATIDIFLLPAALTGDPLWGAATVAIVMTISVLLTYGFVRSYYGRVAATIAALLYATLFRAVVYSRSIWNPNLLPIFVVLFVMALFWGVVARRKGWLFPALFLLGILIQLHPTGAMMFIPFIIALLLAPGTLRWRDLALGLFSLLMIYLPYLLWEISIHFSDVHILAQTLLSPRQKAVFDDQAWLFYQTLFNPYDILSIHHPLHWRNVAPYLDETSMLWQLAPYLAWISHLLIYLVLASMVIALVMAVWTWGSSSQEEQTSKTMGWGAVYRYWSRLRSSPYRCGLVVLLSWQIVPLILLSRHSLPLYLHYFIFLLPGPCILVGMVLAKALHRCADTGYRVRWPLCQLASYGLYVLAGLIIIAQCLASTVGILDMDRGNYSDGFRQGYRINGGFKSAYVTNDLRSLRSAVTEADQFAQRQHVNRVYISAGANTQAMLQFLSTQMRTPVTIFNANCVVLPSVAKGPAVMLVAPDAAFTNAVIRSNMLSDSATATLVDKPKRAGGAPFWLYLVAPRPAQSIAHMHALKTVVTTGRDLQLRPSSQSFFLFSRPPWLVTHWSLLDSASPSYHKSYADTITITRFSGGSDGLSTTTTNQCIFSAMRAGDQVVIPLHQIPPRVTDKQGYMRVKEQLYETNPVYLHYGPLTFLTFAHTTTLKRTLQWSEK